jgi:hypothetical protein
MGGRERPIFIFGQPETGQWAATIKYDYFDLIMPILYLLVMICFASSQAFSLGLEKRISKNKQEWEEHPLLFIFRGY